MFQQKKLHLTKTEMGSEVQGTLKKGNGLYKQWAFDQIPFIKMFSKCI